ncbi:hypothetical protein BUZ50_00960 [Staphylococcus hominis]|uniref:hypothetical protein n=1 Tax=Staphylococcus TaxID=1279 RepID=UPI000E69ADC7|nr:MULTISPECIES: hypothetical protein [Staphylococcus]RIO56776.1 hypothetical protein BUZ50_00960 [Staphylococcus hominis]
MNFKDKLFERYLEDLYKNENNVVSGPDLIYQTTYEQLGTYESFHCQEVYMAERNDDYFCGIRADHFVVEIGKSENTFDNFITFIITANHKGNRCVTILQDLDRNKKMIPEPIGLI